MSALQWLGFGFSLMGLACSLFALVLMRKWWRRVKAAARLVAEWRAMADRYGGEENVAAEELRFCAYWLQEALTRGR